MPRLQEYPIITRLRAGQIRRHLEQVSDVMCKKIKSHDNFTAGVLSLNLQMNIIRSFIYFYVEGKLPEGVTAKDLVSSIATITPLYVETANTSSSDVKNCVDLSLFSSPPEDVKLAEMNYLDNSVLSTSEDDAEFENPLASEDDVIYWYEEDIYVITDIAEELIETEIINNQNRPETGKSGKENKDNVKLPNTVNLEPKEKPSELEPKEKTSDVNKKKHEETNVIKLKNKLYDDNIDINAESTDDANKTIHQNEILTADTKKHANIRTTDIKWSDFKKRPKIYTNYPEYGLIERMAFIDSCHKQLIHWNKDQLSRIILKYFFGNTVLTIMTGITKGYNYIVNSFSSNKFLNFINYINKYSKHYFRYCVPHKKCIEICYKTFSKADDYTTFIYTYISSYVRYINFNLPKKPVILDGRTFHPFTRNIFQATILAHCANFGLELVELVQTIENRLNPQILIYIATEITYITETAESWRRLKKYMDKYLSKPGFGYSHHWARIIDENYFTDLSCENNFPLAVILAVFNEKITGNRGIWLAKWIEKGDIKILNKYKEVGYKMFDLLLDKMPLLENGELYLEHIRKNNSEDIGANNITKQE